jgi:O-antigen/teichoic acid export membrane protein
MTPRLRDIRRSDVADATGYGLRVQAVEVGYLVNTQADRLFLGGFFGPAVVAGFEPGSKLITLLRTPVTVVMAAVFPAVVDFVRQHTVDRLFRVYLVMTRYLASFSAVTVAVVVATADPLVRLWLGHAVPLATDTIALLAVGHGFNVAAGAAAVVTMTDGRPGLLARYAVAGTVLNLVLTVPLLWIFGPPGVPLATTVSLLASTLYLFAQFHRYLSRPFSPLVRVLSVPVLASVIGATGTWFAAGYLPDGPSRLGAGAAIVCRGGVAAVLTVAVLGLFGFVSARDRARLRQAARQVTSRRHRVLTTNGEAPNDS